ncbi:hypothetical protein GC722_13020 [Auraticoccus sp. F435]|uniref:Type II secretion system protein n=1 Tax=Auraticoccus cholistanensis TaxID=2656650 RepID=A0A6A9UYZ6_9ACTN|nr:hypothetical protein [Auraticoccus cholistanensis]MVA76937.1 hypothetical protein [Auraticoccus cholistanensis]
MSALAALLAGLAVFWLVPPAGARDLRRLTAAPLPGPRRPRRRSPCPAVAPAALTPVVGAALLGGRPAAVVVLCLALVALTVAAVARTHRAASRAGETSVEVARACSVLAAELRIGKVAGEALVDAADDCPLLARAAAVHRSGGDVVPVLRELAAAPGGSGLAAVADAWQVSVRTGAPLTRALDRVSAALAADRAVHRLVDAELSAPRATGRMLAVLPLVGLLLGYAVGGDPVAFLLGGWQGQGCLLAGVVLACAGVLWSERLAR